MQLSESPAPLLPPLSLSLSLSKFVYRCAGSQLPAGHIAVDVLEKNILLKMKIVRQLLFDLSCDCHVICSCLRYRATTVLVMLPL